MMDSLHVAHLILVAAWGSLVAAETVVEITGKDSAARIHYWLDLTLEVPILIGILATGAILTLRAWPPSTLHWIKIACALVAIAVNLYCVVMVILRFRTGEARYDARVRWTGAAAPFGLAAAYIGLAYFVP